MVFEKQLKQILWFILMISPMKAVAQSEITDSLRLLPYYSDGKYGYVDTDDRIVIPCGYDFGEPFIDNRAVVHKGNRKGVIDKKGQWVVDPIYNYITIRKKNGFLSIKANKYYNAWWQFWNWRILPDLSIFNMRIKRLLDMEVQRDRCRLLDADGRKLYSVSSFSRHWHREADITLQLQGSRMLVSHQPSSIQIYEMKAGRPKHTGTLKNVYQVMDENHYLRETPAGYRVYTMKNKPADNKTYQIIPPSYDDAFTIFSDGQHYYTMANSDHMVKLPDIGASVEAMAQTTVIPQTNDQLFWVADPDNESGLVTNDGHWLIKDSKIYLLGLYTDGTGYFRGCGKDQYTMFDNLGNMHECPPGTSVAGNIQPHAWILKVNNESRESMHRAYDWEKGWVSEEFEPAERVNPERFYKNKKTDEGRCAYIYDRRNVIAAFENVDLSTTSDEWLLKAYHYETREKFYIDLYSCKELRKQASRESM